jgi:hypothetical protein
MLARRIFGRPLDRAERSLPGYAALKLPLHFLCAALFKRISATSRDHPCEDEQDRRAFHLLILESESGIAREAFVKTLKRYRVEADIMLAFCRFNACALKHIS